MNWLKKAALAAAVAAASLSSVATASDTNPPILSATENQRVQTLNVARERVSRYGQIVGEQEVGISGLTAWVVQKNGHQLVLYSTPDAGAVFTGVLWDAASGKKVSDVFSLSAQNGHAPAVQPLQPQMSPMTSNEHAAAAMDGKFTGPIPESMKTVDSLAGFKEGDGDIANTVYIVVDPRCPYCRQAYNKSREYVSKGHTIKWIPAAALGNPQDGVPLAATILQSKDRNVLDKVLGKHEAIRSEPTEETKEALSTNLAFLFAAFQNNGREQAGVPAAFFLDHRTGKPKMLTGVSESAVLEDIFGKL